MHKDEIDDYSKYVYMYAIPNMWIWLVIYFIADHLSKQILAWNEMI